MVHVLDLWPDTVLAGGFADRRPMNVAMTKALGTLVSGDVPGGRLGGLHLAGCRGRVADTRRGDHKLHYVPMWADEQISSRPSSTCARNRICSGCDIVLLVCRGAGRGTGTRRPDRGLRPGKDPRLFVAVAGSGIARPRGVERRGARRQERSVHRSCAAGADDPLMATADFSYVSLQTHGLSSITMPSKTQAALASGTGPAVAADGDVRRVG